MFLIVTTFGVAADQADWAPLPRGPHGLGQEAVTASQLTRLRRAVIDAVAAEGYGDTTVADVVARAGVSRKTFYVHYADKDEAFLDAYRAARAELRSHMLAGGRAARGGTGGAGVVAQLRGTLRAYLGFLAADPATARAFVVEVLAAGPKALEQRAEVYAEFSELAAAWHRRLRAASPTAPAVPAAIYGAVAAAGDGLVYEVIRAGRTAELPGLEPHLLHVYLALLATPAQLRAALR